jgi:hypothetical protein
MRCRSCAGFSRDHFDGFSRFRNHAFAVAIRGQWEALRLLHAEISEFSA